MYPFGSPQDDLTEIAEDLDGPFVAGLARLARCAGATLMAGMFERIRGERRVFNTVVAVDPLGELRGVYRKLHLFDAFGWAESAKVRPGPPAPPLAVPVAGLTVAVLTCYDLRFPELARVLVDAGADLIAVPAAWAPGPAKEDQWLTLLRARAIENTCYVAAAAQAAPDYCGRSAVIDPNGTVLAGLAEGPGVAVADVTAERVAEVRRAVPALAHRRLRVVPAEPDPQPVEADDGRRRAAGGGNPGAATPLTTTTREPAGE